MPTLEELQIILESKDPLEIELQEDGSIKAVPLGTAVKRTVMKESLAEALRVADEHAARINAQTCRGIDDIDKILELAEAEENAGAEAAD